MHCRASALWLRWAKYAGQPGQGRPAEEHKGQEAKGNMRKNAMEELCMPA